MDRLVGQDGSVGDGHGTEAVVAASLPGTLRRLRCLWGVGPRETGASSLVAVVATGGAGVRRRRG